MKNLPFSLIVGALFISATSLTAQTLWFGANQTSWNEVDNWTEGLPGPDNSANFSEEGAVTIKVSEASNVQGIQKGGRGSVILVGAPLTLGNGYIEGFNSILVNFGSLEIRNDLNNTANKRITLNREGEWLSLEGNLDTGGAVTQFGNLGNGRFTFSGDRSGGNSLLVGDGVVFATGILSNEGGGNTQVFRKGVIVSSRPNGPSIEKGSKGLALRPEGTFRFAAPNQIASFVNLNGGTLDLDGFSNDQVTISNITLTADSVIDFSNSKAEKLAIGDVSKNAKWESGATLAIIGFSAGDSLRFGTDANGLTAAQLKQISFDGKAAQIDASGFVTPVK